MTGNQRVRLPEELVVVDMTDVLERPGSEISAGSQLLQKKGRKTGGRDERSRSTGVPSFKDKLMGDAGKNGLDQGLGELNVEGKTLVVLWLREVVLRKDETGSEAIVTHGVIVGEGTDNNKV
ncbi:hypothetical protein V6N13_142563 [Hibiscus sabdariffa]